MSDFQTLEPSNGGEIQPLTSNDFQPPTGPDLSQTFEPKGPGPEPEPLPARVMLEDDDGPTADLAIESAALARELDLPVKVVLADPEGARREKNARRLEQDPRLIGWAEEDPVNEALLKSDLEPMLDLYKALSGLGDLWDGDPELDEKRRLRATHPEGHYGRYEPDFLEAFGILTREGTEGLTDNLAGSLSMLLDFMASEQAAGAVEVDGLNIVPLAPQQAGATPARTLAGHLRRNLRKEREARPASICMTSSGRLPK